MPPSSPPPPLVPPVDHKHLLQALDLTKAVEKKEYGNELEELQGELNQLMRSPKWLSKRSAVLVFEGPDASGKGGSIRRVTAALDARQYQVVPIAAPTDEERAQPYLWRFWRNLPRLGKMAIFDRSWYGRVLVERVEGFCSQSAYMRAYSEINDFEEQLMRHGTLVVKFYLQISEEEQLRRFKEREETEFKRYKITAEDWRNRAKWDAYSIAASDMVDRTSTEFAPWTLVEANDKNHARLKVLRTLCARIREAVT
jgi:AMP-polyphosphate phosphotransferase